MKVPWLKFVLIVIAAGAGVTATGLASAQSAAQTLTRKEALLVAESTDEAELFYTMYNGRLKNCIEKEVVKPCESGWVTCIENAWVVQFTVGDICDIEHDGRLGLTVLIDALTGKVLSRYPEADYFRHMNYCFDDNDCVCGKPTGKGRKCFNFISGQIEGMADFQCQLCACVDNRCVIPRK